MTRLAMILVIVAVALCAIGRMVLGLDIAEPLVPDPESVVQEFVSQLSEGRYESAQAHLDDDLKQELSIVKLQQLDQALKEKLGEYDFQLGGNEEKQGNEATYTAQVKTDKQGQQDIEFQLQRDKATGLWEISGLEDLKQAAQ